MHTHVAWLSFSSLILIMFCELALTYFHRLLERKLLSGGVFVDIFIHVYLIEIERHTCALLNHANIGLDNGLSSFWHRAITQINTGLLSVRPGNKSQWNAKENSYDFVN